MTFFFLQMRNQLLLEWQVLLRTRHQESHTHSQHHRRSLLRQDSPVAVVLLLLILRQTGNYRANCHHWRYKEVTPRRSCNSHITPLCIVVKYTVQFRRVFSSLSHFFSSGSFPLFYILSVLLCCVYINGCPYEQFEIVKIQQSL